MPRSTANEKARWAALKANPTQGAITGWRFNGTNRFTTRAFRSSNAPKPQFDLEHNLIGWSPDWIKHTHPRRVSK